MRHSGLMFSSFVILAIGLQGCGTDCANLVREREAFLRRAATPETGPHAIVAVPLSTLNKLLATQLKRFKPVKLKTKLPEPFDKLVKGMSLAVTGVKVEPGPSGKVGLRVTAAARAGKKNMFEVELATDVKVTFVKKSGKVRFSADADDFKSVKPHVPSDAADKLADWLLKLLPSPLDRLTPKKEVRKAARTLLKTLVNREIKVRTGKLLSALGEVAAFEFGLPPLPIAAAKVRFNKKHARMLLDITFDLPVSAGVAAQGSWPAGYGKKAAMRLSAEAAMSLVNWAMDQGKIPGRYDDKGRASKSGAFQPAMAWRSGERPLKLHLWRTAGECIYLVSGGVPSVGVSKRKLVFEVNDGRIEESSGGLLVDAALWFRSLWAKAHTFGSSAAAQTTLKVAGTTLVLEIRKAKLAGNEFFVQWDAKEKPQR